MTESIQRLRDLYEQLQKRPHILVCDDDSTLCEAIQEILTQHGCQVTIAHSIEELDTKLHQIEGIDLILLDVLFSGKPLGFEGLKVIKEQSASLPVIFMTGLHDTDWFHEALSLLDVIPPVLSKPFQVERLYGIVLENIRG